MARYTYVLGTLYIIPTCNNYVQGISVEGQENIQEILTKQLVLCQYVCALSVLREGWYRGLAEVLVVTAQVSE